MSADRGQSDADAPDSATHATREAMSPASPWQSEIDELHERREMAYALGGEERVVSHNERGNLTVRQRIEYLLDQGTFEEVGVLTGAAAYGEDGRVSTVTPANSVIGTGRIGGCRTMVAGDDFTVRGGSSEASIPDKWIFAETYATEHRVPLVRLVDAAGGSIKLLEKAQSTKLGGYPAWKTSELLGTVPVVGVALGPCAGLGAMKVCLSHFSVMVQGSSQVFSGGPLVVAPGVGQAVDKESLGGFRVHSRGSGVVDNDAATEEEALDQVKTFLSYMPSSVFELPPVESEPEPGDARDEALRSIIPRDRRKPYQARSVLERVLDPGSVFEIGKYWGRPMITALGRLGGRPVGILQSDPFHVGGALTADAAEKATRFVDLCDTFHLPIVSLVDQPGLYVGKQAEEQGTAREALRLMLAIEQSSVPWCVVVLRRAFGLGGGILSPTKRASTRVAWPSAHWGSIPIEGGVDAAHRREIAAHHDPDARRAELTEHYRQFESPFRTAERFGINDIIDPADTPGVLRNWCDEAYRLLPELIGPRAHTFRV
ncbi:propionyl-CoA carboxylase subunit beta [Microbacterium faecale]|uniref:Propionyl-CoA carboxylase subunit beta n=1 Tax=Microbacterium faecale TaxID=1804630 RepID=A0A916Y5F6_9MICO|nr:carboxyl transferase domain-containing protein [Microbacterium faecale]GGD31600.1 propionyl-CoA carboxylase subunit beta [Microbacterium faecale]